MAGGDTSLPDSYRGGFGAPLPFGRRPALLIVDAVMAYLDPGSPLYLEGEDAVASCARLAAAARAADVPVIFTKVEYLPDGRDGGVFYHKVPALSVFQRGNPLGDFPPVLGPLPGDIVVTKQYASAFFGTSLAATLTFWKIDCLLIGGFSTSGCVRATAVDACQHGFLPFVVRSACTDRHLSPHDANLFDLQAKYAEVVAEDAALGLLSTSQRGRRR